MEGRGTGGEEEEDTGGRVVHVSPSFVSFTVQVICLIRRFDKSFLKKNYIF